MRITDIDSKTIKNSDFVVRDRSRWMWTVIIAFIVALIAIFITGMTVPVFPSLLTVGVILIIVSMLAFYNVYLKQDNIDQMLATEFLNTLLASSLGAGNRFCLIIKLDGSVVYSNRGLQDMFPQFTNYTSVSLDAILDAGKVAQKDRESINRNIIKKENVRLIFPIHDTDGSYRQYMLNISPLERPRDYFVIRAREFVESRKEKKASKSDSNLDTEILAALNNNNGIFSYSARRDGTVFNVSQNLESLLGYQLGQLNIQKPTIRDIIDEAHIVFAENNIMEDIHGQVSLRRNNGGVFTASLQQRAVADGNGNIIGYFGIVMDYGNRLI